MSGTIHILSETLASQVAAGEVVERPASVLKELVENSIDAGAGCIRVEMRRGGTALLKVSDDGCGMSREDAQMAFRRHATSKLSSAEDLFRIEHLGFRGEALPSIASVARVRLVTREARSAAGTEIRVSGGEMQPPLDAGCAPGTVVEVEQLFFNTPARRKFLKSEETEAGQAEHQLRLHALAAPGVRFVFVRDGRTVFDVPATADMRRRIADFFGREHAEKLVRIRPVNAPGIRVSGYLLPLSEARRGRKRQYVFLNSRPIEDRFVARAVRDGFGGFPAGLHPALYLFIGMEPALVDVNVHPAKREVRFRRPDDLAAALIEAIGGTLSARVRGGGGSGDAPADAEGEERAALPRRDPEPGGDARFRPAPPACGAGEDAPELRLERPLSRLSQPDFPSLRPSGDALPHGFRFMGVLKGQYALFENAEGLALLSPRAAAERIAFERFLAARRRPVESQRLLEPVLVEMDVREIGAAHKLLPLFEQAGFRIVPFGRVTLRVEAVPAPLPPGRAEEFLRELLRAFTAAGGVLHRSRSPYEPFAAQLAGQYAAREDVSALLRTPEALLSRLFACEIPYCTPSGRPTVIPLSLREIARKFQVS